MELRDQLQSALGGAYSLERELGGGGMSRVFTATETAFGRRVVIKVLPIELGASVNVDRFKREIQLAANLQHPHIVPVLSASEMDGVPYYTMPFIDGESLRARLATGPLPIGEAVNVLRDVARALAYAHERGVVHRDIKPDNVLLAGGSATVTDFGIAKAITAARAPSGDGGLTQVGMSIGTPSYMSPEQAAADPSADQRSDVYSFGCMAYELLTGQPPFAGLTPQRLLAAHMGERPRRVSELRPDTPPLLADLVMQCLEKDPSARPQHAADIVRLLDTVTTDPSQTGLPALVLSRASIARVLATYAVAFAIVLIVAKATVVGLGAPGWVVSGAALLMAIGLPVLLATAYTQRVARQALLSSPRLTPGGGAAARSTAATLALRASPHLTWRRSVNAIVGGVGLFALLVAALMALRPYGIGPLKSLVGSGKLRDRDKILVADFTSTGSDTTLGPVVSEAVRADLGQSPIVSVVTAQTEAAALQRMQLAADTHVDTAVARQLARREGIKAFVAGDVHAMAGGGFVITMRLVSADSGQELASLSQSADGAKDLIPAIGSLSRQLRRRMGESLRHVQSSPQLAQVTTASLPALEKYTEANRAMTMESNIDKAISLFRQAIALDTSFGSAYRALSVALRNRGVDRAEQISAIEKAYAHADRLPRTERFLTIATYWTQGPKPDEDRAIAAYDSVLAGDPTQFAAQNNLGILYLGRRQFAEAERLFRGSIASSPSQMTPYGNLISALAEQGKTQAADSTLRAQIAASNDNPRIAIGRASVLFAEGNYAGTSAVVDSVARSAPADSDLWRTRLAVNAAVAMVGGRIAESLRLSNRLALAQPPSLRPRVALNMAFDSALVDLVYRDAKSAALERIADGLRRTPLSTIAPLERPYANLAQIYALAGRPDLARTALAEFERTASTVPAATADAIRHSIASSLAMGEKRYLDAAHEAKAADVGTCTTCLLPAIALAYDDAGQADSAIAVFTRYVDSHAIMNRFDTDAFFLAGSYKRLGELWEAKGDREKATRYYLKFVELWKNADPELQPKVAEVRRKLQRLSDTETRGS
ncbi:MAG TPA: protein kinase [Gemmatimonadaceae bacterium]|nr:protein kinase [Gemmatimonadaceae bacterium]